MTELCDRCHEVVGNTKVLFMDKKQNLDYRLCDYCAEIIELAIQEGVN